MSDKAEGETAQPVFDSYLVRVRRDSMRGFVHHVRSGRERPFDDRRELLDLLEPASERERQP